MLENDSGEINTPAYFQINQFDDIVIGQVAKDTYPSLVSQTVTEIRRLMGRDVLVTVKGKQYRTEVILAHFFKYLKASAEEFLGEPVTEAVITVPAFFSDSQRRATKIAGEAAAVKVNRIINEPTAAAITYEIGNIEKDKFILVYNLGEEMLDVSIVEMFDGVVELKASAGNTHLGGMDFDKAIVEWVEQKYQKENGRSIYVNVDDAEPIKAKAILKGVAERVKILLSSKMSARITIPFLGIFNNAPISVDYELARSEFENLIRDMADSTIKEVDRALVYAGLYGKRSQRDPSCWGLY